MTTAKKIRMTVSKTMTVALVLLLLLLLLLLTEINLASKAEKRIPAFCCARSVQVLPSTQDHPEAPASSYGRTVEVTDFASCCVIAEVPSPSGLVEPAAQITLIHFEDSQV
jgi:hypothetical protein